MNIRKLIEKALDEAREEFAAIVARKLEELMGDATPAPEPRRRKAGAPKRASTVAASGPKGRTRAPESQIAALRAKVIAAMPVGHAMKRAQIAEAAGLPPSEALRLSNVLRKLKEENVLSMRGTKASATYTRKG
ncbi:MAG: hypothetical protein ACXVEF_08245 [Polyangiales bacterium]